MISLQLLLLGAAAAGALGALSAGPVRARRSELRRQRLSKDWRRLAERAGLEVEDVRSDAAVARLGNLRVLCEGHVRSPSLGFNGSISFSWVGVPVVSIATRGSTEPVLAANSDPSFDELLDSSGDPAVVRAILDRDTRAALRSLVAVLRSWTLTLDASHARCLAASGQGLAEPGGIARRLAENTTREPLASMRAGNMRQLAQVFPNEPVTRDLARTLISDADPWVRLQAAGFLSEEGRATLIALTRDADIGENCAVQALSRLDAGVSRAEIRAGLERALSAGRWKLAAAWNKRLGAVVDEADVRVMSSALARWRQRRHEAEASELKSRQHQLLADAGVPIAAAIAGALGRAPAGDDRDTALLDALNDPRDVRLAALRGLIRAPKQLRHLWDCKELAVAVGALEPAELPEAKEVLLALLGHPDANVAQAAALQLLEAPMQDEEAERVLVACLDHGFDSVVRAAVNRLGRAGTVRAIPALRDCAERRGDDREIASAVRQAIAEIQSRLPGASPGQLSIAGGEAGQVSLAGEDQRGQVSLEARSDKSGSG